MELLVLAAHDAGLVDHLRAVMHQNIQSSAAGMDVVMMLNEAPQNTLADNQLLFWRDNRSTDSLAALLLDNTDAAPLPTSECAVNVVASNNPPGEADVSVQLLKRIHKRDRKIKSLTNEIEKLKSQLDEALARVQFIEGEQEQFFEDVQHMKEAYDKLHASHQKLLWEYLPSKDPDMGAIPRLSRQVEESEDAIGPYPIGSVLGYGQYATVYDSICPENPQEPLAIKAIDKEKLVDLVTLHRVNSEISALKDPMIHHTGILSLRDVFHTPRHIYLVTERGGKDLFEYFGPHEDGVDEETIRTIIQRVILAVQTLHRHNYCHRDLKPENILYSPTHPSPADTVKIVDFGLCTKATSSQDSMLHDFCGSPGFFAPEILLRDCYDGQKADIWSLGCVILELTLGNERFASMWMSTYELETLKDHEKFKMSVRASVEAVHTFCDSAAWAYSVKLRSLLFGMLNEDPVGRFSIHQVLDHAWLNGGSLPCSRPQRSPTNCQKPSLASHASFSEGLSSPDPALAALAARRPGSAEQELLSDHSSPHVSALLAAADVASPPKTPKLSLPSLSPEKPPCARSPDKSFSKRNAALTTAMPPTHRSRHDEEHS